MDKIIIASGPVIVQDNKVLLDISGDDDFWKFCGGRIKEGEELFETARRRAEEELGIDIKDINQEPLVLYSRKPGDEEKEVILVHFLADYSGDIAPGPDVREWKWFDLDDLPENIAPNIIPVLKHFKFLS